MLQLKITRPARLIKSALLVIVLVLLVNYLVTHSSDFSAISKIKLKYILPVILLSCIGLLLSSIRFYMMLTYLSHPIPFITVLKYFTQGRFLNRFLVFGGSVYRAIMFKQSDGISYKKYLAINLSFDWLNMLYTALLGVIVIAVYDSHLHIRAIPLLPVFGIVCVLLILAFPVAKAIISLLNRAVSATSIRARMEEISEIIDGVIRVLKNRTIFLSNSVIISLIIGSSWVSYKLLFKSIAVDTDLVVLLVYLIILRFFRIIRITPANLGVREFLLGFLTYSFGTGAAEGILVSLLMRLVTLLVQGGLSFGFFAVEAIKRFFHSDKISE